MKKILFIVSAIILGLIAILTVTSMSDQSGLYGFNNHPSNSTNQTIVNKLKLVDTSLPANNTGLLSLSQNVYMDAFSGQTELLPFNQKLLDDYKTLGYNDRIFILENTDRELYLYNAINQEKHFLRADYDSVKVYYDFNSLFVLVSDHNETVLYEQDMDNLLEVVIFDVASLNFVNKIHENYVIMYDYESIGVIDEQGELRKICQLKDYDISPIGMVSTEKYIYLLTEEDNNEIKSNQIYRLDYTGQLVEMLKEDYAVIAMNAFENNLFFIGKELNDAFIDELAAKDPFMTMDVIQMNEVKEIFKLGQTTGSTLALQEGYIVTSNSKIGIENDFKPISFKKYILELK